MGISLCVFFASYQSLREVLSREIRQKGGAPILQIQPLLIQRQAISDHVQGQRLSNIALKLLQPLRRLVDVSDIFYFFCSGEGKGESGRQGGRGGSVFY